MHGYRAAELICAFVFAYAKSRFSHDAAHIHFVSIDVVMCCSVFEMETVSHLW